MTRPPATTATIGESLSGINHRTGRRAALLCLLLVIFAQSTLLRATDFERVRPAAFQGVTPGITTLKQLKAQFNDRLRKKNSQWYIDTGSPFRFVAVDVSENKVVSIHAELVNSRPLEKTTAELGLGLPIPPLSKGNASDDRTYWFYPERGLKLFAADHAGHHVMAIRLLPLESDAILSHFTSHQSDTELQLLTSLHRRGYLDKSGKLRLIEWHLRSGHARDVATMLQEIDFEDRFHRQLLQARHNLWTGEPTGLDDLRVRDTNQPLLTASRQISLARILAAPQVNDLTRASKLVTEAIDQLNRVAKSQPTVVHRLMLESHLIMVQVIATSDWNEKQERLDSWLDNTKILLQQGVSPGEDPLFRVQAVRRVLEALASVEHEVSYKSWQLRADTAIEQAERVDSSFWKSELALERSRIHRQIARLARRGGDVTTATQQALFSLGRLREVDHNFWKFRQQIEQTETLFLLGVLHAIEMNDHVAAVRWYEQAAEHLTLIDPESYMPGTLADRWISMGVSYWTTGKKEVALELTKRGRTRIDQFVKSGRLPASALITPFKNLSAMHDELGNKTISARYNKLSRIASEPATRR